MVAISAPFIAAGIGLTVAFIFSMVFLVIRLYRRATFQGSKRHAQQLMGGSSVQRSRAQIEADDALEQAIKSGKTSRTCCARPSTSLGDGLLPWIIDPT